MQALVKHSHAPQDVSITSHPRPRPGPGQVLVRTEAVGLCGSDVHAWRQDPGYEWVATPVVLGHEAVGSVEDVADDVDASWRGRRVVPLSIDGCGSCPVCRRGQRQICPRRTVLGLSFDGAAAEFFTVDVDRLVEVALDVSVTALVLTEPLAIAVHAVERLTASGPAADAAGDVVVTGPGPIGLMAAMLLHARGYAVSLVGTAQDRPVRLALAEGLGLRTSEGQDFPADPTLWMEASGSGQALAAAVARTAVGGTIVVPALFAAVPSIDVNVLVRGEVDLLGSYGATRTDYEAAVAVLTNDPLRWSRLVTACPLAEATEVLERVSRGEVLKAALMPTREPPTTGRLAVVGANVGPSSMNREEAP